jgi:hypothetical protein
MLAQLAVATVMVLLTVIIHGAGLAVLGRVLRLELRDENNRHVPQLSARSLAFTLVLVLGLFALHGVEIWLYATLYVMLGAVNGIETGVYFSTTTYGTIGFSDVDMAPHWRLVGAIEGVNGILLLGWSTAFFVTVVTRLGSRP